MTGVGSRGGAGRLITGLAVVALAVVAVVLVLLALRPPDVRDDGMAMPVVSATPTPTDTPIQTPSPTSLPPAARNDPQILAIGADGRGFRSSEGDCLSSAGLLESTEDGGVTWTPVAFGDVPLRQILSVQSPDASQIDVVAKAGSSCAVTMASSFTAGSFWQVYPERIAEAVYVDPIDPGTIHDRGVATVAPCPVDQITSAPDSPIVLCEGQVLLFDPQTSVWRVVVPAGATSIAYDSSNDQIVFTSQGSPDCAGTEISSVAVPAGSVASAVTCFDTETQPKFVTVAKSGSTIWYWSDSGFRLSSDGGLTWSTGN